MTPGDRLGPYVVVAELGRGGMGVVLRARHLATGGEVALKVLDASLVDAEAVTRFDLEGQALARVASEGVVPVHAAGVDGRRRWIALGLMEGGSLRDRLKTSGAWPWEGAVQLARGLAVTLGRCHAAGIVHRDLKPENILFDGAGRAHVADFGLVRDLAAQALTATGTVMGTPAYMAPEQLEGLRVDARADVWSLAVLLHELVAGERPWVGKQSVQLLARITSTPRPRLGDLGAPPELDAVLDGALTLDPALRYPDAAAFAAELDLVLARLAPAVLVVARARARRRRLLGWMSVAALLAVSAAALHRVRARRAELERLAASLGADVAAIDSWRGGLRAARLAGRPPEAAHLAALERVTRVAQDRLLDPTAAEVTVAAARARVAAVRARLELAVAGGAADEARSAGAALDGLSVPLPEDAHLRLLGELAAPAPDLTAVKREVRLVADALERATGEQRVDLRLAAARGELALGQAPSAASALAPAFSKDSVPTRGELLLYARCAGGLDDPAALRRAYDRVAALAPADAEELGEAALGELLARVSRLAAGEDAEAGRRVAQLVQVAWDFELDHRERWRQLDPLAATRWPADALNPFRIPERAARPARTLLRPGHAPALRAALARLEASSDEASTPAAARAYELLAVADPDAPPPSRTWEKVHERFSRHVLEVQRDGAGRQDLGRVICADMCDRLRVGLPIQAGALPPTVRRPLQLEAGRLLASDERDWASEALVCALELHDRRTYADWTRAPQRAALRRPLEALAASPLLGPAARAGVALEAAEFGLVHVGDVAQSSWAAPLALPDRTPPWSLEATLARARRARFVAARTLLGTHRAAASSPDLVDGVLAQIALVLGEPAEAERLARRALELSALRDAGRPVEGRVGAPSTAFQLLPVTMRRVLVRALTEQGRTAEAAEAAAADDTIRPR